ncbi:MAG: hypothetical protein LC779_07735 [Actinobacteria bacterium]|nr:hypothetical protein [Actinomycetota bacterium]
MAAELGIPRVLAVGNKARTDADEQFLRTALAEDGIAVAGVVPYAADVADADRTGAVGLLSVPAPVQTALAEVLRNAGFATRR